ncbi:unnamed protein product [Prunus armeniaca]|uniref:Uncharacterized protein n=1 Tax=Prunus armeniaca TaxID=36596 RepID=A0A6J5WTL6_PRUAR|nr:unnamed protein product [Prunus armeniaca]
MDIHTSLEPFEARRGSGRSRGGWALALTEALALVRASERERSSDGGERRKSEFERNWNKNKRERGLKKLRGIWKLGREFERD